MNQGALGDRGAGIASAPEAGIASAREKVVGTMQVMVSGWQKRWLSLLDVAGVEILILDHLLVVLRIPKMVYVVWGSGKAVPWGRLGIRN